MIDYHIHTRISADCDAPMAQMAKAAYDAGLKEICLTEHIDLDLVQSKSFTVDFEAYTKAYGAVRDAFPGMTIRMGIEAGLDLRTNSQVAQMIDAQPLDFVIGSQHLVFALDPYYDEVWQAHTHQEVIDEYLRVCVESAAACAHFDVFGHIGYLSKCCPYEDKVLRYGDYPDILDTLLKTLIEKGKGIEVNTSGLRMTPSTIPETAIIRRYCELGGEIITVGSDAHRPAEVGLGVNETLETLKSIGFRYVCAFSERRPSFIPIP